MLVNANFLGYMFKYQEKNNISTYKWHIIIHFSIKIKVRGGS